MLKRSEQGGALQKPSAPQTGEEKKHPRRRKDEWGAKLSPPKKRVEIAASGEVSSQKKKTRHEKVYFSQDKKKLTWLESHLTIGANHLTFSDLPPAHTLMRVLHSGQRGRGEMRDKTHFRAISLYAPVQNCSAMAVADNYSLSKHIYLFIYFSPHKLLHSNRIVQYRPIYLPNPSPSHSSGHFSRMNKPNYLTWAFKSR